MNTVQEQFANRTGYFPYVDRADVPFVQLKVPSYLMSEELEVPRFICVYPGGKWEAYPSKYIGVPLSIGECLDDFLNIYPDVLWEGDDDE